MVIISSLEGKLIDTFHVALLIFPNTHESLNFSSSHEQTKTEYFCLPATYLREQTTAIDAPNFTTRYFFIETKISSNTS